MCTMHCVTVCSRLRRRGCVLRKMRRTAWIIKWRVYMVSTGGNDSVEGALRSPLFLLNILILCNETDSTDRQ